MNPTTAALDAVSGVRPAALSRNSLVTAVYRVRCAPEQVESLGRDIALEQTVEVPESLISAIPLMEQVVGRVQSIEPVSGTRDSFCVTIAYNLQLTGFQIPQLLNLLYGNVSLKPHVALVDVELPDAFINHFRGPKLGGAGLRKLLGVYGRPLLATALKPVGSSPAELAGLAFDFALGGGDLVKDDHNLHEPSFDDFCERVARCQEAVTSANARTGRQALYLPNLMAPVDLLERHLQFLLEQGIRGVLVAPFLLGLDQVRAISEKYPLLIMAHPTVSGAFFNDPGHGIDPGLLLGTLFRLIGADVSIFPNSGGRFTFTDAVCRGISSRLQRPLGDLAAALPAPAGGMRFDNIPQMAAQYGSEAVYLIGGALLSHSSDFEQSTREFLSRMETHFATRLEDPETEFASACEIPRERPSVAATGAEPQHLIFRDDFVWDGRTATVYKTTEEFAFRAISRHELIGGHRERTAFDLRYFQIEPGGYSSLEKHAHTHTIICVRGTGTLVAGESTLPLNRLDVAYVPPLQVHQLRNETPEPFGFFCIVDHKRDKPQQP